MPLDDVVLGDPHVTAHNAERSAINATETIVDDLVTAVDANTSGLSSLSSTVSTHTTNISGLTSDLSDLTAEVAGLASGVGYKPETYGAVGDGSTDDTAAIQAAIDAASTAGGGIVILTAAHYRAAGLIMKTGVLLTSFATGVKWAGGHRSVMISPPSGWAGGWVIDSPATAIETCGVSGIAVSGGMSSTSSPDTGGIRLQNVTWGTVEYCSVGAVSLGGIYVHGTANIVRHNGVQNFWQWRDAPISSDEGSLTCTGTDFFIEGNQANGGSVLTDTLPTTTIENLHQCANLFTLLTSVIIGGNGEFAQVGIRASLFECVTVGMRADTNIGVGVHLQASSFQGGVGGTRHIGMKLLANCLSPTANEVLDQLVVDDSNTDFDGIMLGPDWVGSGNTPRYGVNDRQSLAGWIGRHAQLLPNRYRNVRAVYNAGAAPFAFDIATRSFPFSFLDGQSGPAGSRPEARFSTGKHYYDTQQGKPTFSDGTRWRDAAGNIVSNLMSAALAYASGGVLKWDGYNPGGGATATVVREYAFRFLRPRIFKLTTTAAGVTAGYAAMISQAAEAIAVSPTTDYQVGMVACGPAGKACTGQIVVSWFTSGAAFISATTAVADTTITAGDAANPTVLMSAAITSPATAAFAYVSFLGKATGLATNDVFKVGGPCLVKAGSPVYTDVIEV